MIHRPCPMIGWSLVSSRLFSEQGACRGGRPPAGFARNRRGLANPPPPPPGGFFKQTNAFDSSRRDRSSEGCSSEP